jgi:hypothetical protein
MAKEKIWSVLVHLTKNLQEYIEKHRLCSDYIFADWEEFLELLYSQGSCVTGILWFEHVRIDEQADSLGGGGFKDAVNPAYMYAETDIQRRDMETLTLLQVKQYIHATIAEYPGHKLLPAFFGIV